MTASRRVFMGLPLDPLTEDEVVDEVAQAVARRATACHASLNAAKVVQASEDERLHAALHRFDLVTADGQSVVWTARILGQPVPERVAGIDLMNRIIARAAQDGWSVYLLGGRARTLDLAQAALLRSHPGLILAGKHHGYFRPDEEEDLVAEIRSSGADIVFVALGSPEKELFLDRHRDALGVGFAMGVGGAFDVIAGIRKRAPGRLQRLGLEWAFRLAQEPRRLAPRYLTTNARFVWLAARELPPRERAASSS